MTIVCNGLVFAAGYYDWVIVEHSDTGKQTLLDLAVPAPIITFLVITALWYCIELYEEAKANKKYTGNTKPCMRPS